MSNARRYALIVAIVGLITAVVGLGGALIGYMQSGRELVAHATEAVGAARAEAAKEHAKLCSSHTNNLAMYEGRFAELQAEHGILVKFMRACFAEKEDGDKGLCTGIVCASAWAVSSGQANCFDAAAKATQYEAGVRVEQIAAKKDKCEVPTSAMQEFLAEK